MTTELSTSTNPLPSSWIERLFEDMLLTFGKRFTDMWSGVDPEKLKLHWAERLSSLTRDELRRGFESMKTRDWPPSLNEFVNLCRPPIKALDAYCEAVENLPRRWWGGDKWSHPAIFWAASKMESDLLSLPQNAVFARFERALKDELEKGEWPDVPRANRALSAPEEKTVSAEEAKKNLSEIRQMISKANLVEGVS